MKVYAVGGWVRDRLLGRAEGERDRDWVVVGATPEDMIAAGFKPVGRDFPVFLHPQTHEEYALARTERKTAPGYKGFVFHAAPDVTLEQDLARRDLTINAIAMDENGALIDPFGGRRDLEAKVLRHVGPSFVEDPVRVLRVARFAARFHDFGIAPETRALMRAIVDRGEADALVPERVWQELARGLMERRPSRMIEALEDCGLIARLYPELTAVATVAPALDRAAERGLPLAARFAILAAACGTPARLAELLARLPVDGESAALARLLVELRPALARAPDAQAQLAAIERADALRRPERFESLLQAVETLDGVDLDALRRALRAAASVDAGAIAARHAPDHAAIAAAVRKARLEAIAAASR
ncbi:MAG: multifunctional CCA addition/repair protein [Burkholderiaceae bacterium]